MEENIKVEETKKGIKSKVKDAANTTKEKASNIGKKIYDNRGNLIKGFLGVVAFSEGVKRIRNNLGLDTKSYYRNDKHYYEDHLTGRRFEVKREIRPYEYDEIEYRKRKGEPTSMILSSMGLLKKRIW